MTPRRGLRKKLRQRVRLERMASERTAAHRHLEVAAASVPQLSMTHLAAIEDCRQAAAVKTAAEETAARKAAKREADGLWSQAYTDRFSRTIGPGRLVQARLSRKIGPLARVEERRYFWN